MRLAEELSTLQAYGRDRLAEGSIALGDIPAITRRVLKGRG
ncbi:hypothetical protein [Allonocardiopsis opalescens]|nr:hypothetical protein [Allonocardiopsis opalescens]